MFLTRRRDWGILVWLALSLGLDKKDLPHWAFFGNAQWGSACDGRPRPTRLVVTSTQTRISYNIGIIAGIRDG